MCSTCSFSNSTIYLSPLGKAINTQTNKLPQLILNVCRPLITWFSPLLILGRGKSRCTVTKELKMISKQTRLEIQIQHDV